jgi:hypothetical protein
MIEIEKQIEQSGSFGDDPVGILLYVSGTIQNGLARGIQLGIPGIWMQGM